MSRAPLRVIVISVAALTAAGAIAADNSPVVLPPVAKPLPAAADKTPHAIAMLADYRYDDLLWENDKTAHRIYGHALEAAEPHRLLLDLGNPREALRQIETGLRFDPAATDARQMRDQLRQRIGRQP